MSLRQCARRSAKLRRGVHHLLEVVEQQQQGAIAQIGLEEIRGGLVAHLEETQGLGNDRDDELRITDRGEGDKADAVGERVLEIGRDLQREAGLADATGTGQGYQPVLVLSQETTERGDFALPPDQARQGHRESRRRRSTL